MKLEIKNKNTKKFKCSLAQKGGRVDYNNQRKIGKRWFAKIAANGRNSESGQKEANFFNFLELGRNPKLDAKKQDKFYFSIWENPMRNLTQSVKWNENNYDTIIYHLKSINDIRTKVSLSARNKGLRAKEINRNGDHEPHTKIILYVRQLLTLITSAKNILYSSLLKRGLPAELANKISKNHALRPFKSEDFPTPLDWWSSDSWYKLKKRNWENIFNLHIKDTIGYSGIKSEIAGFYNPNTIAKPPKKHAINVSKKKTYRVLNKRSTQKLRSRISSRRFKPY